jgi:hypothetical protein
MFIPDLRTIRLIALLRRLDEIFLIVAEDKALWRIGNFIMLDRLRVIEEYRKTYNQSKEEESNGKETGSPPVKCGICKGTGKSE